MTEVFDRDSLEEMWEALKGDEPFPAGLNNAEIAAMLESAAAGCGGDARREIIEEEEEEEDEEDEDEDDDERCAGAGWTRTNYLQSPEDSEDEEPDAGAALLENLEKLCDHDFLTDIFGAGMEIIADRVGGDETATAVAREAMVDCVKRFEAHMKQAREIAGREAAAL